MSNIPGELLYTESHEWIRRESDGSITIGVTDHAQCMLGDLVFVDLPAEDFDVQKADEACVLESVKAAADVYAPVDGVITEVNSDLNEAPDKVNQSPYDEGWLFKMMPADESSLSELMDAEAYESCVQAEAH